MVYFDNAATTYPKPPSVVAAMSGALVRYGANPGRAGHKMSLESADAVFSAREKCADFFGADVENTVFMPNCTFALNTAIKGVIPADSHVITSDIEHNAVLRPLFTIYRNMNVSCSYADTSGDDDDIAGNFEKLINRRTKTIVCTMAGNVNGRILPIKKIAEICEKHGLCLIVDAAQGAGVLPIKLSDGVNIICAAGHKGLYGPMGTGLLITDGKYRIKTLVEGGTGSNSKEKAQPEFYPDRLESGTINTAGAISLGAGVSFVVNKGRETIYNHEWSLCRRFYDEISKIPNIKLCAGAFDRRFAPVVPFNIGNLPSEEVSAMLSRAGFALRGGFQCAYPVHKKMHTDAQGAVRFSPSVFSTAQEVNSLVRAVASIAAKNS